MNAFTAKPTLVCLTGLLCDQRVWQPVASLLESEVSVQIISFSGFDNITQMARHVLASVEGTFALAGHSMGGRVALEVYRLAPERITHLALMNTGVHPKSEKELPGRLRLLELAKQEGTSVLSKEWLAPMMSPKGLANTALMHDLGNMVCRYSVEAFEKQLRALIDRPDAESILPSIVVPTLLLSGTEDHWSPVSQHQTIQEHLASSKLVVIEEAGHMAPIESPQAVAEAMMVWLKTPIKGLR
ncbi:alpha/beta fold hydrolase [Marinomonas gallaica]|uniref:alpha/beta fold hydrolase n=1 Tax=Marinomonas gallaica TaxID=1806667 RepID=UPI003CE533B9